LWLRLLILRRSVLRLWFVHYLSSEWVMGVCIYLPFPRDKGYIHYA
jgi:hypothetical protein